MQDTSGVRSSKDSMGEFSLMFFGIAILLSGILLIAIKPVADPGFIIAVLVGVAMFLCFSSIGVVLGLIGLFSRGANVPNSYSFWGLICNLGSILFAVLYLIVFME